VSVLDGWWPGSFCTSAQSDVQVQPQIMRLITTALGLQVRPQDEEAIAQKLKGRSQSLGLPNLNAYYKLLLTANSPQNQHPEWRWLTECLTTTESYFFRDKGQFSLLRQQILPELINYKRQQASSPLGRPSLRLWSAGCSSGEEAYSLAILLRELIPDFSLWDVTILGTDINQAVLDQARSGTYSNWSFRSLEPTIQQRYFQPHRNGWQIRPDIRSMVTFQVSNLVQDAYPDRPRLLDQVDLIVCRNVFIYFKPEAIAQVLHKFYATLQPQGYLLAGHTELQGINLGNFHVRSFPESVIYQRPGDLDGKGDRITSTVCRDIAYNVLPHPPIHPSTARLSARAEAHPPIHPSTHPPIHPPTLDDIHPLLLQRAYPQAIQQLQQILQHEPQNGAAHHLLAQVYANGGQHEQAIAACQKAMQVDPLAIDSCYLLAQIREEQGDLEEAKILYKRIIYLMPESIHAYLELASLYVREGNRKKAFSVWKSALDLVRRSPLSPSLEKQFASTPGIQTFTKDRIDIAELERYLKSQLGL